MGHAAELGKPMCSSLTTPHRRRLRDVWRSAGWPCRDVIEVELLASGMLERHIDAQGRETLQVSDDGVRFLADTLDRNRQARDPHEALVTRVALQMHRAGRLVWRGLGLRAPLEAGDVSTVSFEASSAGLLEGDAQPPSTPTRWVTAIPDVFSVRQTTVEAYLEPVIHEIKVRRSDLLADVKRADKRAAYLALAGECWYVLREGIGGADDVPDTCGVVVATELALDVVRTAPRRPGRLPLATWMAMAKATRCDFGEDDSQGSL